MLLSNINFFAQKIRQCALLHFFVFPVPGTQIAVFGQKAVSVLHHTPDNKLR